MNTSKNVTYLSLASQSNLFLIIRQLDLKRMALVLNIYKTVFVTLGANFPPVSKTNYKLYTDVIPSINNFCFDVVIMVETIYF